MQQYEQNLLNQTRRRKGLTVDGMRLWGAFFTGCGMVGQTVIQNGLLKVPSRTNEELLALLDSQPDAMVLASLALLLQFASYCAVPIFAALLAEGFVKTGSLKQYFLRVAGLALVSELPYNLAVNGTLLDPASRNPVFGLVLGLVVLYLLKSFADTGRKGRDLGFTAAILVMGALWAVLLQIECGLVLVLCTAVLYRFRHNTVWQLVWGAAVCALQFPAPMGLLCLYGYNGKPGSRNRKLVYGWYPLALLAAALVGMLLRGQ